MLPSIFGDSLFDGFFDFPDFGKEERRLEQSLYGRHAGSLMKTDIKEKDNEYEMLVDLPGFSKDEVNAKLENGYLTISAEKGFDKDDKDKETGRYIRRERFAGSCQRSYYVGDTVKQEDVKAEFHHGILTLHIPKTDPNMIEQKKNNYIAIEG